jgi:copper chaperone CopZ
MVNKSLLASAVLALGLATPSLAAPTVKATVGHMCCGSCERSVKTTASAVAWVADAQTDRAGKTVTVSPKAGMEVDAITLLDSLRTSGFPATQLELTGGQTLKMDAGHVCCAGCANGLKAALAKVSWIQSADVKVNGPAMLTVKPGATANLTELIQTLTAAGYSVNHLIVSG